MGACPVVGCAQQCVRWGAAECSHAEPAACKVSPFNKLGLIIIALVAFWDAFQSAHTGTLHTRSVIPSHLECQRHRVPQVGDEAVHGGLRIRAAAGMHRA